MTEVKLPCQSECAPNRRTPCISEDISGRPVFCIESPENYHLLHCLYNEWVVLFVIRNSISLVPVTLGQRWKNRHSWPRPEGIIEFNLQLPWKDCKSVTTPATLRACELHDLLSCHHNYSAQGKTSKGHLGWPSGADIRIWPWELGNTRMEQQNLDWIIPLETIRLLRPAIH